MSNWFKRMRGSSANITVQSSGNTALGASLPQELVAEPYEVIRLAQSVVDQVRRSSLSLPFEIDLMLTSTTPSKLMGNVSAIGDLLVQLLSLLSGMSVIPGTVLSIGVEPGVDFSEAIITATLLLPEDKRGTIDSLASKNHPEDSPAGEAEESWSALARSVSVLGGTLSRKDGIFSSLSISQARLGEGTIGERQAADLRRGLSRILRGSGSSATVAEMTVNPSSHLHHDPDPDQLSFGRMESFLIDALRVSEQLQALLTVIASPNSEELALYITSVHAIKSACANIREPELSLEAASLEKAGRVGDLSLLETRTARFLEDLAVLMNRIRQQLAIHEDNLENELSSEQWISLLGLLTEACERYDQKAARDIVGEMRAYRLPVQLRAALITLQEAILSGDFPAAVRLVSALSAEREGSC